MLLLLWVLLLLVPLLLFCNWGLWADWGFMCIMSCIPITTSRQHRWFITSSSTHFCGRLGFLRLFTLSPTVNQIALTVSPTVSQSNHPREFKALTVSPTVSQSSHTIAIDVLKPSRGACLDPGFSHMPAGNAHPRIHCCEPVLYQRLS